MKLEKKLHVPQKKKRNPDPALVPPTSQVGPSQIEFYGTKFKQAVLPMNHLSLSSSEDENRAQQEYEATKL